VETVPGETDLRELLRSLEPELHPETFVFCTIAEPATVDAVATIREAEGITVICRREAAERTGLPFTYPCRMITLRVHSSLEAVGLLAAVSTALAREGIGVNVLSAFYHDHLFVAVDDADRAMRALGEMQRAARL
jgi:hypothetical protein